MPCLCLRPFHHIEVGYRLQYFEKIISKLSVWCVYLPMAVLNTSPIPVLFMIAFCTVLCSCSCSIFLVWYNLKDLMPLPWQVCVWVLVRLMSGLLLLWSAWCCGPVVLYPRRRVCSLEQQLGNHAQEGQEDSSTIPITIIPLPFPDPPITLSFNSSSPPASRESLFLMRTLLGMERIWHKAGMEL